MNKRIINYAEMHGLITQYLNSWAELKKMGVIKNKTSFTTQLSEFLVAELYKGKLATNSTQKDWDVECSDGTKIQVKAHAKASSNLNKWTPVPYDLDANINLFIIVVFSEDYKLKHFFTVPWQELYSLSNKDKARRLIRWNQLYDFDRITDSKFRKHPVIKLLIDA